METDIRYRKYSFSDLSAVNSVHWVAVDWIDIMRCGYHFGKGGLLEFILIERGGKGVSWSQDCFWDNTLTTA